MKLKMKFKKSESHEEKPNIGADKCKKNKIKISDVIKIINKHK